MEKHSHELEYHPYDPYSFRLQTSAYNAR